MLRGRSDVKCYDKNKTLIQKQTRKENQNSSKGRQDTFGGDGSAGIPWLVVDGITDVCICLNSTNCIH